MKNFRISELPWDEQVKAAELLCQTPYFKKIEKKVKNKAGTWDKITIDMQKPEIFLMIAHAGEKLGMNWTQACASFTISDTQLPALYGDAGLALVRGTCTDFKWIKDDFVLLDESRAIVRVVDMVPDADIADLAKTSNNWGARCRSLRGEEETVRIYTVRNARRMNLWNPTYEDKPSTKSMWFKDPMRMLSARARSWLLQYAYPDILKGFQLEGQEDEVSTEENEILQVETQNTDAVSKLKELI